MLRGRNLADLSPCAIGSSFWPPWRPLSIFWSIQTSSENCWLGSQSLFNESNTVCPAQSERADVQEDLCVTAHKNKRYSRTNCSKSFGPGLRPPLACCWPSPGCLSVPAGCVRRHSGSAGRLAVKLPTDGRTRRSTSKGGGSKRGRSKRGNGTREAPCGNHSSSSRAATMDSKAHSMSFGFPVSAAVTRQALALNQ